MMWGGLQPAPGRAEARPTYAPGLRRLLVRGRVAARLLDVRRDAADGLLERGLVEAVLRQDPLRLGRFLLDLRAELSQLLGGHVRDDRRRRAARRRRRLDRLRRRALLAAAEEEQSQRSGGDPSRS